MMRWQSCMGSTLVNASKQSFQTMLLESRRQAMDRVRQLSCSDH